MKKLTTFNFLNRKASKNLALGILMSMGSLLSFAQTITTTVATGTTTQGNVPIYGYFGYTYSQQIYLATDFDAAVVGQLNAITKIRFFNASGSLTNANSWTVFLGATSQTSFTSTTNWVPLASMTQVYSGSLTAPAANTWMEITLQTPFIWDGVSNIVVAVDENTTGYSTINWRSQSTGADRSMYYYSDSNNPNPASPPTGLGRFNYVPQAQFVHEIAPACSATPTHATAVSSVSTVCENIPVNLSLTGTTFATGLGYQWQYNDGSGPGWVNFPTGTTAAFSTPLTQTVNVRAITTCIATSAADTTDDITITVNAAPVLTVNTPQSAYCAGGNVQLIVADVAPTTTYTWLPATGLNVANNDTVLANPTNATTYTVTGLNAAGCSSTATALVTPVSKATRTASYSPNTICAPGSPVTITAAVTPTLINGGSTWEYRFLASNGSELQTWNSSNTYNFIPTADSIYKIYYQVRSNGCPDYVDSLPISVIVGFGADVAVVNYDCNNLGGTVSLSNTFDPTGISVYSNPFASSANLTNVALSGNAAITAGRLVLTPSATGNTGSAIIPNTGVSLGVNNSFSMKFKLTADLPINTNGTGGADGLTYSFGDDVVNTGNQNGSGSKFRLIFDACDNSSINMAGIYIVYGNTGGVSSTSVTPTAPSTLFYSNNLTGWKLKTDVLVEFKIDNAGKASLLLDGVSIFSNIQMPAAYMTANTSTWKHAFSATTGGDALRQAITDLSIFTGSAKFALVPTTVAPTVWGNNLVYTGVQPGTYDVWMSNDGNASCAKMIETIEMVNTNPLVLLGNDTTICEGESITLDAGNAGSTYVWSNSQVTTQTRVISQEGPYVVNVTAANGCVGVGSINIDVMDAPSASTIFVQNNMPTYTFTVLNPQNTNQYSWDFGDGTTVTNTPGTVSHTYLTAGPRQVSVTLTNECGTETVVTTIVVTSTASVGENTIEGLSVYPNPATDMVTIALPNTMEASVKVFDLKGGLIQSLETTGAQTEISVSNWNKGVYFLHVQNDTKLSIVKLVIQ
ncbi:T9SS type A sorting domain-containing protein [Fluviicola taffensis]|uniref:PKD domain containing protein n=1 Tax=Fluviicola taffensis (strain DSM 16823 / NCIMB 13979 / RW262) TaxID=755732 RepID=F2I995_FLUTR|nr:T9SS type A sorting domain-containing protein [Fluviicola taffensis]AEA44052.1 PKD domain containing protein [Fluviicola taffensis DSM 16823]